MEVLSTVQYKTVNRHLNHRQIRRHSEQSTGRGYEKPLAVSCECSTSDDDYLCLSHKIRFDNVPVEMLTDTGVSINIFNETTFAYI